MSFRQPIRYFHMSLLSLTLTAFVGHASADDGKVQAVGSFTIVSDIVEQVGGERVDAYNIIKSGNDPHEWDPSPMDTKKTADADAVFYFGWNLEGIQGDTARYNWVKKLLRSVDKDPDTVFTISDGIEQKKLGKVEKNKGLVSPQAFTSPKAGLIMTQNVRDALIKVDPDHAEDYKANADALLDELKSLDQAYQSEIQALPEENRVLFTGERSFQYVAEDYDLKDGFIWEIDGNEEGTPAQIKRAIKFVETHNPPSLFYEYNVDKRPMNTVADATGVEVSGTLISDDIGEADSYVEYLEYNLVTIVDGLSSGE
ncbi:metal ABC transporter solute-binding protein, Zn/Mn family [Halomonas garicola]|uniref:metal ABC transporter solute-binding protein, Zn/Mn family n=1 Tax=Halomonas garicola TaxID=1690008 RepID=UPI00289AFF5F|nr:zinc ABC transporter substrate-binding protein [Halomonas garicola]